eukprot:5125494-Alexandrium_andersonii.AAC.1
MLGAARGELTNCRSCRRPDRLTDQGAIAADSPGAREDLDEHVRTHPLHGTMSCAPRTVH